MRRTKKTRKMPLSASLASSQAFDTLERLRLRRDLTLAILGPLRKSEEHSLENEEGERDSEKALYCSLYLKDRKVRVVVPAYNEEKHIGTVLQTMPDYLDKIVVVDDSLTFL